MTLPVFIAAGSYLSGLMVLAALAGQSLANNRKAVYAGRHRGAGRTTRREEKAIRNGTVESRHRYATHQELRAEFDPKAVEAAVREPTQEMPVPDFGSDVDDYRHRVGAGRYAHLRPAELDAAADRAQRLAEFHARRQPVDLAAVRVGPFGAPETADEWIADDMVVAA